MNPRTCSPGDWLQVRSFAKEGAACERYSAAQGDCLQWGLKTAKLEGFFFAFSGFLAYSAVMSVLWFGARKVRASLGALLHLSHLMSALTDAARLGRSHSWSWCCPAGGAGPKR